MYVTGVTQAGRDIIREHETFVREHDREPTWGEAGHPNRGGLYWRRITAEWAFGPAANLLW